MIQQLYAEIQKQTAKHSVIELCEVYGVSRSGYYKWLKRDGAPNRYEQTQKLLDYSVADVHAHYPSMGYRAVRDVLQMQSGWVVCDQSIWKSMKRLGIKGYTRKRKLPTSVYGLEHTRYPNLLHRNFKADRPMEKIVTDVTYINYKSNWFYLAAYLDLFNNEIVEWELSDSFDNFLVMRPAERLLKKTESTEHQVLLHSDQGVQYSSAGFCNLLQRYNATQSMSRAGTPYDNAVMESFWGRFKDVLRSHFRYWERDNLHETIAQAFHYFNCLRPIRKLNGKPPVQYRIELAA